MHIQAALLHNKAPVHEVFSDKRMIVDMLSKKTTVSLPKNRDFAKYFVMSSVFCQNRIHWVFRCDIEIVSIYISVETMEINIYEWAK